jgi:SAM-dependent methyltransferase
MNPLLSRLFSATEPVEKMTEEQRCALTAFRRKLEQGVYTFEDAGCLCGRPGGWHVAARDRFALPVDTWLCPRCGLLRTTPRMTGESLGRFYADDYRALYVGGTGVPEWFFSWQTQNGQKILDFVRGSRPDFAGSTVFDVGCGAGGTLLPFRAAGCRVFGCDTGRDYLERGKSEGLTLEFGEAPCLRPHGPADLVILSHVLEHLPHPLASLSQVRDLLAPQGLLYVELPGIFSILRTYGDALLFLQNAHLYHFTLETLSALLARAGFRLVKGDQLIRALYEPAGAPPEVGVGGQAWRVLSYLCWAEVHRGWRAWRSPSRGAAPGAQPCASQPTKA